MSDTSDVDESECTIYMEITSLAASALAATICFVISQLLQQATLLPIFTLYFFELFPESAISKKIIDILSSLGAEKDEITAVVKAAVTATGAAICSAHPPQIDQNNNNLQSDNPEDVQPDLTDNNSLQLAKIDATDLASRAKVPAPRFLQRSATTGTIFKMENAIKNFKVPLFNFFLLDFHGYVIVASVIYCSTSMVTVSFILWDAATLPNWYHGGFDESLSAYNIFLSFCTIFGLLSMLLFVIILNEVYTLENLRGEGFTLESKSKATADALFWVSVLAFIVALCIKWVYLIICLYIVAVLFLEVIVIALFAGVRQLLFYPVWTRVMVPSLRQWAPWLFVDDMSYRVHSPAYFIVFGIVYLMNCVTQMSYSTIRIIVDKTSLAINLSFFMYSVILFTFVITVGKRDPHIVYVCVSTSTIVVTAGYLGSAALFLARPLLYLIYGENTMRQFGLENNSEDGDDIVSKGRISRRSKKAVQAVVNFQNVESKDSTALVNGANQDDSIIVNVPLANDDMSLKRQDFATVVTQEVRGASIDGDLEACTDDRQDGTQI